jgi:uncharacterized SAM-binding protein YcdF (DUF218 family)
MKPDALIIFTAGIMPLPSGGWRSTTYDDRDALGTLGGRDRVEAAALLAKEHPRAYLVATSRRMTGEPPTLAEVYANELRDLGVASGRIVKEENSINTETAVHEALQLAKERGWRYVIFLSNEYHLPRILAFSKREQSDVVVDACSSESMLIARDRAFKAIFEKVKKSSEYQKRLASEARGLEALEQGSYRSVSAIDKKECKM